MIESRVPVAGQKLAHGDCADYSARSPRGIQVLFGAGRGCQLRTDSATAAIWIPLRGRIQIGQGSEGLLPAGEVRVTEAERVHAVGRGNALWVALLARAPTWAHVMQARLGVSMMDAWLLAARHAADFDLRRRALGLARAIAANHAIDIAMDDVLERIVALQAPFIAAIAKCPGRTFSQRRQVFVRLQRVRNYIAANCTQEIENGELARMANYSSSQFIRAFRNVYGDTPHAYLIQQRLGRAQGLLRETPLAINEIALAAGFENASTFSRVFRRQFGVSAGTLRREAVVHAAVR